MIFFCFLKGILSSTFNFFTLALSVMFFSLITSTISVSGTETEVKNLNGYPALFINGTPQPAMMVVTQHPILNSGIVDNQLNITCQDTTTSWRLLSKQSLNAGDITIEGRIKFSSPSSPNSNCNTGFKLFSNKGEYDIGLGGNENNRHIMFKRTANCFNKHSKNWGMRYKFEYDRFYKICIEWKGDTLSLYLDGKLLKKVKDSPRKVGGPLRLSVYRGKGTFGELKITDKNGKTVINENWSGKDVDNNWQQNELLFAEKAAECGIKICQIGMSSEECFKAPGNYDFSNFEKKCLDLLNKSPESLIVIRMVLSFPRWRQKGPKVEGKNIDGKTVVRSEYNYSDEEWQNQLAEFTSAAVKFIDNKSWGKRVIGTCFMMGHGGEFVYNFSSKMFHDYSSSNLEAYKKWLPKKYNNNIAKLNQKWNCNKNSFDEIQLPTPKERTHPFYWKHFGSSKASELANKNIGNVLFPTSGKQRLTDFLTFHNEVIVSFINKLVNAFKVNSKQKRIVGVYYGYNAQGRVSVFNKGHNAFFKLLNSNIDFITSPYNYKKRLIGNPAITPLNNASIAAYGKLPVFEDDTRTFYAKHTRRWRQKSVDKTISIMKRNFASALQNGGGIWYIDFGSNWFTGKRILELLKKFQKIERSTLRNNRVNASEIVVLISEKSFCRMYANTIVDPAIQDQRLDGLSQLGAPFDCALVSTLPKLKDYKLYIFLNPYYLSEKDKEAIRKNVMQKGKTALWVYAPGIISKNGISIKQASEITGIKLKMEHINAKASLKTPKTTYTFSQRLAPIISVIDPEAQKLGQMKLKDIKNNNGQSINKQIARVGLAKKKFANWTSVYCSVPKLPASLLRRLAQEAGAHIYNNNNNYIYAGSNWFAIHAVQKGKYIITPKENTKKIQEMFSGRTRQISNNKFTVEMEKGDTYMWKAIK